MDSLGAPRQWSRKLVVICPGGMADSKRVSAVKWYQWDPKSPCLVWNRDSKEVLCIFTTCSGIAALHMFTDLFVWSRMVLFRNPIKLGL